MLIYSYTRTITLASLNIYLKKKAFVELEDPKHSKLRSIYVHEIKVFSIIINIDSFCLNIFKVPVTNRLIMLVFPTPFPLRKLFYILLKDNFI